MHASGTVPYEKCFWCSIVNGNGKITFGTPLRKNAGYAPEEGVYSPGGVMAVFMTGRSDGASYCEPNKIHEPEILHPKKYLASKLPAKKIPDLNTSILIYSLKQALRPEKKKKNLTDFLTPQKTLRV